jgi:hypothetical protein
MNKSYNTKYVAPNARNAQPLIQKRNPTLIMNNANFPEMKPRSAVPGNKTKKTEALKKEPSSTGYKLDFKRVAEASRELPDPITVSIVPEIRKEEEPKEVYDLSAYVRLQENRQLEYDDLYGEGAFVTDRLKYDRFSDPSDSSSSEEEEENKDECMDY